MSQRIYTQYDNKCKILLTALCRIQCITAEVINPGSAVQRVYVLYINIYNEAALFILSTFIMPSEGHFGIRYDMDFLPPTFPPFLPFIAILLSCPDCVSVQ